MLNRAIFLSGQKWRKKSIFLVSCSFKHRCLCWFHMLRCVRYFSWHGLKWLKGKKRKLDNRHTADTEHAVEEFLYGWKRHHCTHIHSSAVIEGLLFDLRRAECVTYQTQYVSPLDMKKKQTVTWWDESVMAPLSASRYRNSELNSKITCAQREIEA